MAANELDQLTAAVLRRTAADGVYGTTVPELCLSRFSAPTELAAILYEPCLCVVTQGAKEIVLAGETYRLDPAHTVLVSVDLPVSARVATASPDRPYLGVRLPLDPAVVGELLADHPIKATSGTPARGLAVTPVEPALLDAVGRLVALFDSPDVVGALAPLVLREITYRLLIGPQGARLRQIASAGAPAQRIARAINWLKTHFADPLSVGTLAKLVGLGPSAFHLHFKNVTALSPLQYQERLRLQEARRLLLGEGLGAAEAAFRVGYESPSQFGREYRRMFGASPRKDVDSLKAEVRAGAWVDTRRGACVGFRRVRTSRPYAPSRRPQSPAKKTNPTG